MGSTKVLTIYCGVPSTQCTHDTLYVNCALLNEWKKLMIIIFHGELFNHIISIYYTNGIERKVLNQHSEKNWIDQNVYCIKFR